MAAVYSWNIFTIVAKRTVGLLYLQLPSYLSLSTIAKY